MSAYDNYRELAKTPAEEHIDMRSRREVINFCLKLKNSYEDYPFEDPVERVLEGGLSLRNPRVSSE